MDREQFPRRFGFAGGGVLIVPVVDDFLAPEGVDARSVGGGRDPLETLGRRLEFWLRGAVGWRSE